MSLTDRCKDMPPDTLNSYRNFKKDMINNVFGSQMVRMKLRSVPFNITSSVGGITTAVIPMAYSGLSNNSDLTNVFDEVRFLPPMEFTYYSQYNNYGVNSNYLLVGVIDYDDSSVLATTQQALSFDTARVFYANIVPGHADSYETACKWHGKLIGQPDGVWNTTTSYTQPVAWFKTYNLSPAIVSSTTLGFIVYTNEVEFRQSN